MGLLELIKNMSKGEVYNLQPSSLNCKGRADVICFCEMASFIIYEMKKKKRQDKDDVIRAAAQIIKAELRELDKPNTNYPAEEEINIDTNKNWGLTSLQFLLRFLIPSE